MYVSFTTKYDPNQPVFVFHGARHVEKNAAQVQASWLPFTILIMAVATVAVAATAVISSPSRHRLLPELSLCYSPCCSPRSMLVRQWRVKDGAKITVTRDATRPHVLTGFCVLLHSQLTNFDTSFVTLLHPSLHARRLLVHKTHPAALSADNRTVARHHV